MASETTRRSLAVDRDSLDTSAIRGALGPAAAGGLAQLTVLQSIDSTNAWLGRLPARERHAHAVLADTQSAGRGRRQRRWHSPPGGNLYLSLGWRFQPGTEALSTLPLAAAVHVCQMLDRIGLSGHAIKWPNDVMLAGRKLAGILVESQSAAGGTLLAIVGIGLNVRMPESGRSAIERPWTDLASHWPADTPLPRRALLAAHLLDALVPGLERFAAEGFAPFRADWVRRDLLFGRRVVLEEGEFRRTGTARGIDRDGALLVDIDGGGIQVAHAGEVSVRDA